MLENYLDLFREAYMFKGLLGEKKSYLEQLREYCENVGITLELTLDYGTWYIEHDERRIGFSDNTEDAAKMTLEALKNIKNQESSIPHEDALRAYCGEKKVLICFIDVYLADIDGAVEISYPGRLPLYSCQWGKSFDSIIRTKEDACKQALKSLKHNDGIKAKQGLYDFCLQNDLKVEPYLDSKVKVFNDLGYIIGDNYEVMLEGLKLQKARKCMGSMFEDREDIARRRLKKFCDEEGLTLSTTIAYRVEVSPGDGRASLYFANYKDALSSLIHSKTYGDWIWKNKDKAELEKFCTENGLSLSFCPSGIAEVQPHSKSCQSIHFANSKNALRDLKINKQEKLWAWAIGPNEKALRTYCLDMKYKLCDEKSDSFEYYGIRKIYVAQHPDITNSYGYQTTKEEACDYLLIQLKDLKGSGPYERKVRELCDRKGWRLINRKNGYADNYEPWIIDVEELAGVGVQSFKKGEPGFKEVWDNIQKLKELLS